MGQKDHQIILGKGSDETLKLSVKTLQRHFLTEYFSHLFFDKKLF